uniref:1-phosphatidylinositol 4-kinase n=1 Tax=Acrobeloides nanus TaxID=290746 RepID=A0A914CYD1_9BILA
RIGDSTVPNVTQQSTSYIGCAGFHSPRFTRHIEAVGVRFRLLSSVLNMIQGDASSGRFSKNILRQRVYSVAFDYFTLAPQTPTQSNIQLKNDIKQLINFWNALFADAKYIKKETFATNDLELNLSNIQQYIGTGSQYESISPMKGSSQTWHGGTGITPNYANTISILASQTRNGTTSRISSMVRQGDQANREIERQIKSCLRRRQLLLLLVSSEIERMSVWLHPMGDQLEEGEATIDQWLKNTFIEARSEQKLMREMTKFAWDISPQLAVHLSSRFSAYITLSHLLTWSTCSPMVALALLCPKLYAPHPITIQYAVRVLRSYSADVLLLYIPQIVQAIRYDTVNFYE